MGIPPNNHNSRFIQNMFGNSKTLSTSSCYSGKLDNVRWISFDLVEIGEHGALH